MRGRCEAETGRVWPVEHGVDGAQAGAQMGAWDAEVALEQMASELQGHRVPARWRCVPNDSMHDGPVLKTAG